MGEKQVVCIIQRFVFPSPSVCDFINFKDRQFVNLRGKLKLSTVVKPNSNTNIHVSCFWKVCLSMKIKKQLRM